MSTNDCCWRRIYWNRGDGSVHDGNLPDLVDAIRAGADIKVQYWRPEFHDIQLNHTCPSVTTSLDRNDDYVISAIITDIPETSVDLSIGHTFDRPFAYQWLSFNSSGKWQIVKFDRKSSTAIDTQVNPLRIRWFVRGWCEDDDEHENEGESDYNDGCCWKKIYSNNPDGSTRSGDIDDLVDAVHDGADVKVQYNPSDRDILWSRACTTVGTSVDEDGGPYVVSGIITDIPDTRLDYTPVHSGFENLGPKAGREFDLPYAYEWMAFNTSGRRQMVKFDRQSSTEINVQNSNIRMDWYVRGWCNDD